jgi:uncharacterized lipoprotein YehR (DUF1307 family)
MKKFRKATAMLFVTAVLCIGLVGCGKKKEEETLSETDYIGSTSVDTISLNGDGSILEIACDDYSDVTFDYSDLEQYIQDEISSFNSQNGADKVTLLQYQDVGGVVRAAIQYADWDSYNAFNGTGYTVVDFDAEYCDLLVQKALGLDLEESTEAVEISEEELAEIGMTAEDLEQEAQENQETVTATFTDAVMGGEVDSAEIEAISQAGTPYQMICIDSEMTFSVPDSEILYINSHATLEDSHSVSVDGTGTAVIVFK